MVSRQAALALMQEAFPGRDAILERAYRESEAFRDLCRDYRTCALALERWRGLEAQQQTSRTLEYAKLLAELTSEVESWLEAVPGSSVTPRVRGAK